MKHRSIAIIGVLLLALLGMLPRVGAQVVPEITPMPTRSILLVADAFVRSGPDESFVAVGQLLPGAPLIPLNVSEDGDWVLIRYNRGFGWIRRDLALWSVDIDNLPPLAANLTPTFIPGPPTATPFFPTNTPSGDFVQVNATSAYLRGGPSVNYLRLGQLFPGATLEPVGRNEESTWILIRYKEGFAWLRADLGFWVSDLEGLPVLRENRLTPSATFTASNTPTRTPTPTDTATPTDTPTLTATVTNSPTPTSTDTATSTPSPTNTETPSATPTDTPTATDVPTETPSVTPEPSATNTASPEPTIAPSDTATDTPTDQPTAIVEPTSTFTDVPTATSTEAPSATNTDIPTATDTATATVTSTDIATETSVPTESETAEPTGESALAVTTAPATDEPASTATEEPTATDTPSPEPSATNTTAPTETDTAEPTETETTLPTDTATGPTATVTLAPIPTDTAAPAHTESTTATPDVTSVAAVITVTPAPTTNIPAVTPPSDGPATSGISPELIAAGALILLILGYIALYLRGAATASQYANGFVIDKCPVCGKGHLTVESRTERSLGIPNTKHVVRCDNCRSVIRESGGGRWRYAVDRAANPAMYDRLNNREIREDTLKRLLDSPEARPNHVNPEIVDDEPQT